MSKEKPQSGPSDPAAAAQHLRDLTDQLRAQQATPPPTPPRRWPFWVIAILLVISVALNTWLAVPRTLAVADVQASVRARLYAVAGSIEEYRIRHGQLPAGLADVYLADEEVAYARGESTFTLTARRGDSVIVLRSDGDLAPFAAAFAETLGRRP